MTRSLPFAEPQSLGFSPDRLQRIANALNAEIEAGTLPGAILAIARQGKVAFFESFGHLDPAARTAMPKDAIFSIASMTKPIVTVAALTLYEEGRLMVNEPVGKYLPQLARMRVAAPACDGISTAETVAPMRDMTLQDPMRHTAGLSYGRGNTAAGTYFWVDPSEALVVVFMAHAPGAIRYYHRQLLHALVSQSLN